MTIATPIAPDLWIAAPSAGAATAADPVSHARTPLARIARRRIERQLTDALIEHVGAASRLLASRSHSHGRAALLVVPPETRPGVDLEYIADRDVVRLASLACAPEEQRALEHLSDVSRLERFYVLWTLKEAFAKALGLDLFSALAHCTFSEDEGKWQATVPTAEPWSAVVYRPWADFVLAAVVVGRTADHWRCGEWPDSATGERHWTELARFHG